MHFRLGGMHVIVVSSGQIAKEMLHNRYEYIEFVEQLSTKLTLQVTRNTRLGLRLS